VKYTLLKVSHNASNADLFMPQVMAVNTDSEEGIHWVCVAFDLSDQPKALEQIVIYLVEPSPAKYSKDVIDDLTSAKLKVIVYDTEHQVYGWICGYFALHYGSHFARCVPALWKDIKPLLTDMDDEFVNGCIQAFQEHDVPAQVEQPESGTQESVPMEAVPDLTPAEKPLSQGTLRVRSPKRKRRSTHEEIDESDGDQPANKKPEVEPLSVVEPQVVSSLTSQSKPVRYYCCLPLLFWPSQRYVSISDDADVKDKCSVCTTPKPPHTKDDEISTQVVDGKPVVLTKWGLCPKCPIEKKWFHLACSRFCGKKEPTTLRDTGKSWCDVCHSA